MTKPPPKLFIDFIDSMRYFKEINGKEPEINWADWDELCFNEKLIRVPGVKDCEIFYDDDDSGVCAYGLLLGQHWPEAIDAYGYINVYVWW